MKHFVTLTGNLLAERTFVCPDWKPGQTLRAKTESFQVGGKGINVAKMLSRLGDQVSAVAFVGGCTGESCRRWLEQQPYNSHLISTSAETRSGLVVRTETSTTETTFLGIDQPPDSTALRQCAEFLDTLAPEAIVALCGSFPGWTHNLDSPLRTSLRRLAHDNRLVVDSYGPPLINLSKQPLSLLKINAHELRALAGCSEDHSIKSLLQIYSRESPVRSWIITDGPGRIWACERGQEPFSMTPPSTREVSATGCGDVFLAAYMHAYWNLEKAFADAITYAIPFAVANAAHPGIAEFDLPAS